MSWHTQLRSLPIRTKLAITVVGAVLAVLGLSTYLSFQYWQKEARAVAEQQALLAAASTRLSLEASLNQGNQAAAQRALEQLRRNNAVASARVYGPDGRILLSATPGEAGESSGRIWLPAANELPRDGVARTNEEADTHSVHAFVPIGSSLQNVLEVEFSLSAVEQAMERGARLGVGLLIASLLALAVIMYAMLQREVVAPLHRVALLLNQEPGAAEDPHALETGVAELVQKGETARQLAEQRRMQLAERAGFAEVGELAAEMAHEFKRPLAAIRTGIQLLEQEYLLGDDQRKLLGGIDEQLERLNDTMRDVFGLAKPVSVELEDVNLRDVLDNALLQFAAHVPPGRINVRRDYLHSIPIIKGDPRRLEVAFLNLMNNAAEAMPEGGTLTVRVVKYASNAIDISFTDTGAGIDKADLQNVLKPFFSTKPTGTGLGLPLVARIVAAHEGQLLIESEKGDGTTVRIRLPVTSPRTESEETKWLEQESSSSTTTTSSAQ